MSSPSLLLALAPAASAIASRTVNAVHTAGESFASVLGNLVGANQADSTEASGSTSAAKNTSAPQPTLPESIRSLADQLRKWLQDQGATSDYSIDFHLSPDGTSQLDVDGKPPDEIKQLLASDTSWMAKLRQLASSMQADSANRYQAAEVPSVTIEIDATDTRIY